MRDFPKEHAKPVGADLLPINSIGRLMRTEFPKAPGGGTNDTCTPRLYLFDPAAGLRHSQYYSDPQALKDMAAWLRHRYDDQSAL
jgi:hypothetical protein